MTRFQLAAGALLSVSCVPAQAQTQTPVTVVNVWAAETQQFSHFGSDVRLLGDLLVVGAEMQTYSLPNNRNAVFVGSTYVFRQTGQGQYAGYAEEAVLRPVPAAPFDGGPRSPGIPSLQYGFSVGACVVPGGDTFVVGGAPDEPTPDPDERGGVRVSTGAAYVHRRDAATGAWALDGRLAVPDPRAYTYGGTAVAIACEAPAVPGDPPTVEAVVWADTRFVIWHRDAAGAWSMRQTIPSGGGPFPVSGVTDVLVMSSPGPAATRPALLTDLRGAQVWRRTGPESSPWVVEATLSSPLTGQDEGFGRGLDIDRDLIVVGTQYDPPTTGTPAGGRAHVYRYTGTGPFGGWEEEAVLTPAVPRYRFGSEVAVWAGAAGDGVGARVAVRSAGAVTTFRRDAPGVWHEEVTLDQSPAASTYPWTGVLGGVDDRHVALGWYKDNARGSEAGTVFLLDLRSVVVGEGAPGISGAGLAVTGPNPVRRRSEVTLTLAAPAAATVALFDALGRRVALLHEGMLPAGASRIAVDVSGLTPGVYVVRAAGGVSASVRLSVVR